MRIRVTSYTFDASAKTVTAAAFTDLEAIQLITNVTTNDIIYQFNNVTKGGSLAGNILTLDYDTSLMADTDKLMILIDDGQNTLTVDGITGLALESGGNLASIKTNTDKIPASPSTAGNQTSILNELGDKLDEATFTARVGEVQATPTSNTILGRLKDLLTNIVLAAGSNIIGKVGIDQTTPGTTNKVSLGTDTVKTDGSGVTQPVSGTVTANAGTNLNTSALAVESGGNLASIKTNTDKIPSQGQALASGSTPVVLPASQISTLTPPAAITGYATETTLSTRLSESDFDTKTGSLTETAPATDTASSGLNGRLQRIAQRLTSLITAVGSPFQAGGSIGNTTFASTQSGTWTVQPGNTANTTAWKVDGSAVTQPISGSVTADTEMPAAAALGDGKTNPTTPMVGADLMAYNGTTWDAVRAGLGDGAGATGLIHNVAMLYNGSTYDRTRGDTTGLDAHIVPKTSGGLSTSHTVSAASTNATVVKNSAGQLFGWYIYNSNAAARKVAFHNTTSTPTAGSSVFFSIVIPPTSAANVEFANGIAFSSGIAFTMVTGLADSDSTGVAANDLVANLFYK